VKLRYAIGGIAAAALLALPAGAAASQAGQVNSLTAQQCAQEKADIGKKAFRKRYGAKHTMRNCAKRTKAQVAAALNTATAECQDEYAESGLAQFIDDYGEDATDTVENAMAECIAEAVDEILNPEDYVDDGSDDGSDA
jgi:L-lactate utilization protein LutB